MGAYCNGATVAIILTTSSLVISGFGVFNEAWWKDGIENTYTFFTLVNCTDELCSLAPVGQEGWVVFGQVAGLTGFILLLFALLIQFLYRCCEKAQFHYVTVALLGISCLFSLLHTFVTVSKYHQITNGMMKQAWSPRRHDFIYDTLPVGLVAISASLCVPACIALMVHRIKQTYDYKTDPKNPNRIV